MGRSSNRDERRAELLAAFERVLAARGYRGATVAAVAAEAGVAPGLVHHHFESKRELLTELLRSLLVRFSRRIELESGGDELLAYVDAALALDERADIVAARCWVGVLAEALRDPALFDKVRRIVDAEIAAIEGRARGTLDAREAGAVLAFVVGALVLGAFAPRKTAGFAAPALRRFVAALRAPE